MKADVWADQAEKVMLKLHVMGDIPGVLLAPD